ncbi:MAG: hypothetical protein ACRDNS_03475 [Trebonia sp.]
MTAGNKGHARFVLSFGLDVPADLAALERLAPDVLDAARAIVDDLARGRVRGKQLGDRHVSGDLTGLARVKFDVLGQRPQRFRVVYRQIDDATRHVIAIGLRDEHAVYRTARQRVTPSP